MKIIFISSSTILCWLVDKIMLVDMKIELSERKEERRDNVSILKWFHKSTQLHISPQPTLPPQN